MYKLNGILGKWTYIAILFFGLSNLTMHDTFVERKKYDYDLKFVIYGWLVVVIL